MQSPTNKSVQRAATRAPLGIPIRLQADDSMEVIEGICKNISIGGMFIQVDDTRPQGSLMRFELPLEDGAAVRGLGEVVWMRPKSAGPGVEAGIGIKFRFLEQRDRQLIFKLVSQYIKDRLSRQGEARANTPPPPVAGSVFQPPDPMPAATAPPAPAGPVPVADAPAPPTFAAPDTTPGPGAPAAQGLGGFQPPAPQSPAELATAAAPTVGSAPLAPKPAGDAFDTLGALTVDEAAGDDAGGYEAAGYEAGDGDGTGLAGAVGYRASADSVGASVPPRRKLPVGALVGIVLIVLFLVLAFVFRDRLFGPQGETPGEGTTAAVAEDPGAAGGGPVDGEPVAATPPSATQPATSPDPGSQEPTETVATPDQGAATEPQPSTVEATPEPAPAPPPPAPAVRRSGYTKITGITWSETANGLRVIFEGDGPIPENRYKYFRLDGETPREVIQFLGVEEGFEPDGLTVGGPGVEQIRTGFHRKRNGPDELHVVMDMSSRGAKVDELRSLGFTLEVVVTIDSP